LPIFSYAPPWEFLFGTRWYPVSEPPTFGITPFFVATLWVTVVATAVAVPVGVGCAAYLAEVAPATVRETLKPIIELLAGIPSVVMGFIGLLLLSPLVQSMFNLNTGLCGLAAGIMLSLMSLPIIVTVSEDALRAIPDDFRQAAYALGATRWEVVRHVSIPAALSGIAAAIMLGIGRAIGETMTVLMIAGGALAVPVSPTQPMMPMTAAIASGIGNAVRGGLQYQALFAVGLLLFLMTLAVNLIADGCWNGRNGSSKGSLPMRVKSDCLAQAVSEDCFRAASCRHCRSCHHCTLYIILRIAVDGAGSHQLGIPDPGSH
jgi:phosphate transport system permease protein